MRTELAVWLNEGEMILVWPMYLNTDEGHKQFLEDVVREMCYPELGEPISETSLAESREVLERYMDAPLELQRVEEDTFPEGIEVSHRFWMDEEHKLEDIRNKIVNWELVRTGQIDPPEDD